MPSKWDYLTRTNAALSLLSWVPWKKIVGVLTIVVVPVILAAIEHVPAWGLVLVGLGALVAVIGSIVGLVWLHDRLMGRASRAGESLAVVHNGFEFYARRLALQRDRPLVDHVKQAHVIWAAWHTGSLASDSDVFKLNRIQRLVLPNPTTHEFQAFCRIVERDTADLGSRVRQTTREAVKAGVAVRWYGGSISNTLMIGNPESLTEAWAHVETLMPFVDARERPSFRFNRDTFPELFGHLKASYERVWQKSEHPPQL